MTVQEELIIKAIWGPSDKRNANRLVPLFNKSSMKPINSAIVCKGIIIHRKKDFGLDKYINP